MIPAAPRTAAPTAKVIAALGSSLAMNDAGGALKEAEEDVGTDVAGLWSSSH